MKTFLSSKNRYRVSSIVAVSLSLMLVTGSGAYAALTFSNDDITSDEDLTLQSQSMTFDAIDSSGITLTTDDVAQVSRAIYLHSVLGDHGAGRIELHSENNDQNAIKLYADQSLGATSINLLSDQGGINLEAGLDTGDAININASNEEGGIDMDAGSAGLTLDAAGAIYFRTDGGDIELDAQNYETGSIVIRTGESGELSVFGNTSLNGVVTIDGSSPISKVYTAIASEIDLADTPEAGCSYVQTNALSEATNGDTIQVAPMSNDAAWLVGTLSAIATDNGDVDIRYCVSGNGDDDLAESYDPAEMSFRLTVIKFFEEELDP